MQIISSLLNLQSMYSKSKNTEEIFQESQDRVKAMSLVHEKLYRSQNLEKIDFAEYITSLVSILSASYERRQIKFKLDLSDVYLDINTAIPCGLIINELVTNSIKHAFSDNQKGTIYIKFSSEGDELKLIINDDGVGLPTDFDMEHAKSLGLLLVTSLIQQLDGDMKIHTNNGTEFEITFKELKYEKRI
jgi:two-component sensor histidine kinase